MNEILASPGRSLAAGLSAAVLVILLFIAGAGVDGVGLFSFLLRWLHVLAGIVWVGMIWFVNFIQFSALQEADDAGRATLMRSVVPRVAHTFRHASHMVLLTGILMLVASGYLFDRVLFAAEVYVPLVRTVLLWSGALGGIAMWALVNFLIWPRLQIVLAPTADPAAKLRARDDIKTYARLNLVLAVPVTAAMVGAAHLY
jgi:uncharacterized membrane protein